MANVAVPMRGGETRWITEEERARIARKYGPPDRWNDPNPRTGAVATFDSYVPSAADVRELDREAARRAEQERRDRVSDQLARERATRDRRRFLPPLTEAVARGMQDALLHRSDPTRYPATPAAARWLDGSLTDLSDSWLAMAYHPDPRGRGRHGLAMAWLLRGGQRYQSWNPAVRQHGALATSDLPGVLDNVANVLFLDAYTEAPRTFTAWTRELNVPDFRSTVVVTPSFPALLPVPEHAEYTRDLGPLGPTAPLRLTNYGRQVTVTRQSILADDVIGFAQLQQALGVAAAACESDAVYDLLTSNPTMTDGNALFSAPHGNLMVASDLTAASLATASTALAGQTAADGRALHLPARYLVVGTLLGTEARQLVTTMTPANTPPDTGYVVVEDGRIPGKGWYLMTDAWPTVAVAHLAATGGPELLSRDWWDGDGRLYKGRDEFGAAVMDWRSMVYTPAP